MFDMHFQDFCFACSHELLLKIFRNIFWVLFTHLVLNRKPLLHELDGIATLEMVLKSADDFLIQVALAHHLGSVPVDKVLM